MRGLLSLISPLPGFSDDRLRDKIQHRVIKDHELGNSNVAQTFWTTYRHGLLHNVTMSRETHGITHDSLKIVDVESSGKIWLNPVLFSERVLCTIENDFPTFEGGSPALPTVSIYPRVPEHPGAPYYYLGTGTPPGQSGKV